MSLVRSIVSFFGSTAKKAGSAVKVAAVALALMVAAVVTPSVAHAQTSVTPPDFQAVISTITDKFYPMILPVMGIGVIIFCIWWVFYTVKGFARHKR